MAQRVSFEEGLELFKTAPLDELAERAFALRQEKNPGNLITFVLDTNPNYTNICNADCTFCAFYRKKGAKDAYAKSLAQITEHLEFARKAGLTTMLLQGGLNDDLPLSYYVDIVKKAKEDYPDIYPHFFTAPELWNLAKVEKISLREVLQALYDAGQRTIPGGGAEILSERVRKKISPKKMGPNGWIDFHKTAHELGFRTTATMMYGHIEEAEDILFHLETLRQLQDETSGFTAFIPWSYKRFNTALRRKVKHWSGEDSYLRIIAFSRLYLDNFDHVQASWFSEGKEVGKKALQMGADDFGGIILEENVHRATDFVHKIHAQTMIDLIEEAGFTAAQRKTPLYDIVRIFKKGEKIAVPELQKLYASEKDRLKILQEGPLQEVH